MAENKTLKCPFCGTELLGTLNIKYCPNPNCEHCYSTVPLGIWQALTSGKQAQKALKIASAALKHARNQLYEHNDVSVPAIESIMQEIESITTKGE